MKTATSYAVAAAIVLFCLIALYFACKFFPFMDPFTNWVDSIRVNVGTRMLSLPFDSATWKAKGVKSGRYWTVRFRMSEDLIHSKKLIGLTPAEVKSLLGEYDSENNGVWFYDLGVNPKYESVSKYHIAMIIGFSNNKVCGVEYFED